MGLPSSTCHSSPSERSTYTGELCIHTAKSSRSYTKHTPNTACRAFFRPAATLQEARERTFYIVGVVDDEVPIPNHREIHWQVADVISLVTILQNKKHIALTSHNKQNVVYLHCCRNLRGKNQIPNSLWHSGRVPEHQEAPTHVCGICRERGNGDYLPCPSAVTLHPFLVLTALLPMFHSPLTSFLRLIKM